MGSEFEITLPGYLFDPRITRFAPLIDQDNSGFIGIRVYYPDFTEEDIHLFMNGTSLILDVLLRERSAAVDIGIVEIARAPSEETGETLLCLDIINEYVTEIKRQVDPTNPKRVATI